MKVDEEDEDRLDLYTELSEVNLDEDEQCTNLVLTSPISGVNYGIPDDPSTVDEEEVAEVVEDLDRVHFICLYGHKRKVSVNPVNCTK